MLENEISITMAGKEKEGKRRKNNNAMHTYTLSARLSGLFGNRINL
jgi:hypothetical protein